MKHDTQTRPPEEIQAEIEQTRHHLDETLSALESRLTPGQLMDQGIDYLKRSGARQYVSNLGETAKNDPLPLALVGIGLAWLMTSSGRRHDQLVSGTSGQNSAGHMKERMSDTANRMSAKAQSARERAGQFGESARARAGQIGESARARASQIGQSARQLGESARQRAGQMREGYRHVVDEQPLAIGAVGLALGALLGAGAPRTRVERRLAGERDLDRERDDDRGFEPRPMTERPATETQQPATAYGSQAEPSVVGTATTVHH